MHLARVIGNIVSTDCYEAFEGRKLMLVQKLDTRNQPDGNVTMAIDYVGAGEGDLVLVGAAPGLASTVFGIPDAPMRELIMGVVDRVSLPEEGREWGNSVPGGDNEGADAS